MPTASCASFVVVAILPIRFYPDGILTKPAEPVRQWNHTLFQLIDDLIETLHDQPGGIGIAAPQVGGSVRVIVIHVPKKKDGRGLHVLINPKVVSASGQLIGREGCMSLPDFTGNVLRSEKIEVEALERQGEVVRFTSTGLEAVCLQHEIDHLNGLTFIHRVNSLKTDIFRRKRYLKKK